MLGLEIIFLAQYPVKKFRGRHSIIEFNSDTKRGVCAHCGDVRICFKHNRWKCAIAVKEQRGKRSKKTKNERILFLKRAGNCERCGFQPENICQLCVHHRDFNRHNNDPSNHQTLCRNCHELIHHLKRFAHL
jgi:hypothetical protein